MDQMDVRWLQRFSNFKKAFGQLEKILSLPQLNEIEEQGCIQAFEYTFELSWKTMQDLLKAKGLEDAIGPRPVIRMAFQVGLVEDGAAWLEMQKSRNLTSHAYQEETAKEVLGKIRADYYDLFATLKQRLEKEEENG